MVNENKLTFFSVGSCRSKPQLVEGGQMWQKLVGHSGRGFWFKLEACETAAPMLM